MRWRSGARRNGSIAGFTLIELVIVIVVVSILVSIALPTYQASMLKGRRTDAKAGLMEAANRQESYLLDRGAYTRNMKDLGYADDPMISEERHYRIDVDEVATTALCDPDYGPQDRISSPPCYVLTATPVPGGAQADDTICSRFILNSTGAKAAEGSGASECW